MKISADDFFPQRPEARPTIYAYQDTHPQYEGIVKVGYIAIDVRTRVAQQYPIKKPGEPTYRTVLGMVPDRADRHGNGRGLCSAERGSPTDVSAEKAGFDMRYEDEKT